MSKLSIDIVDGVAKLRGQLNRHSVEKISKANEREITKTQNTLVDLSDVTEADTAGLAWLLYLVEQATAHKCQLTFAHLPSDLLKLAQLSAVSQFLPTAD